jgi:hypothetical protein
MGIKTILLWILGSGLGLFLLSIIFGLDENKNPLTTFVKWIDKLAKKLDWSVNSNRFDSQSQWWYPEGHSWKIFVITIAVLIFLVYGPTLELGHRGKYAHAASLILITILLAATYMLRRKKREQYQPLVYLGLPGLAALALFIFAPEVTERSAGIYQHIFLPFIWILLFMIFFAWLILVIPFGLFRRYEQELKDHLTELEIPEDEVTLIDWKRAGRSILLAPVYHPLEVLLWPSFFVLAIADRGWMTYFALFTGLFSWALYAAAEVHERLDNILGVLRRAFFIGGQFLVSVLVIGLAVGRIADIHYVTTLIEASPHQANWTILFYILAFYIFFWFYEYWINRLLGEHLLKVFGTGAGTEDFVERARITYDYKKKNTDEKKTGILQIHGGSRFAFLSDKNADAALKVFGRIKIVNDIIEPAGEAKALTVKHRIRFYFMLLSVMLAVLLAGSGYYLYRLPQKAELSIPMHGGEPGTFNLKSKIFAKDTPENILLLAASGGGSRAALYTQSILNGLQQLGTLNDLLLVSGVSGGSAALAYFAGYRDDLLLKSPDADAWPQFSEVMTESFIQDVLEGITEWRMIAGIESDTSPVRENVRLGQLLKESFDDYFCPQPSKKCLSDVGQQNDVGLIFNTALAGMFERELCMGESAQMQEPSKLLSVLETECKKSRTSMGRGGRLIITNLKTKDDFPPGRVINGKYEYRLADTDTEYLKYIIINNKDAPLSVAAALSANFPPVFPNAAVDVGQSVRYWVTDGGAMDNRGIISLLYALQGAVKRGLAEFNRKGSLHRKPPKIHIIVADASAVDLGYSQDRGIGAAFGAPARLASQLMVNLMKSIEKDYKKMDGRIELFHLNMPLVLRSNGGLGTHWMFPANVTLRTPFGIEGEDEFSLEGDAVKKIVADLHRLQPNNLNIDDPDVEKAWDWICKDGHADHRKTWERLVRSLGSTGKIYDCPKMEPTQK